MARDGKSISNSSIRFGRWGINVHPAGFRHHAWWTDYDFIWVPQGELHLTTGGVRHEIGAGDVLLMRPGMTADYDYRAEGGTRTIFIHFVGGPWRDLPDPATWPVLLRPPGGDLLRPLLAGTMRNLERGEPTDLALAADGIELALRLAVLDRCATIDSHQPVFPPAIERVVDHVAARWTARDMPALGLAGLTRASGVSREHLCRLFKAEVGASPAASLRLLRLGRGAQLLARTSEPVAAVAAACAFATPFHFSRCFKQAYGCSPSAYRERHAGGDWTFEAPTGVAALGRLLWQRLRIH